MQSMPVTATPPITSAQSPASADSNAAQATEPFGNVLARQRANVVAPQDSQQNGKQDGKQSALSPANDAPPSVASKDSADGAQVPVPDAGAVPADMLAALLPATTVADKSASKDKADAKGAAPDGSGALPGDMLAMLLPATMVKGVAAASVDAKGVAAASVDARGIAAASEKGIREIALGGDKKARSQQIETATTGEIRHSSGSKAAVQPTEISVDSKPVLSNVQKGGKPGEMAADINASKEKVFAAALEASAKGAAKAAQFDAGLTKTHMQPDTPAALNGLLQSGVAPLAASQNGAAQAVINTPVAHEAWGNEFNQKVTWMATQHEQTAELHLNPPNLGPLDVVLKVSGDQATALFTSPHAAVRDAVEQALPKLREMMADNGIMLGNAMVSDQSPKDQQAWQASQQQKGSGGTSGEIDAGIAIGAATSSAVLPTRRHQGMVDTFV